jgi:hypothetical protein
LSNTSGQDNVALGDRALVNNQTGAKQIAIGTSALAGVTSGCCNVAVGMTALQNATGSGNVAVGANAGLNATTGSNNIYLGANVEGVAGEVDTMYLGLQGAFSKTFIAGIRGITTVNNDAIPVMIDSAGQLGTVSSSLRFKEDIHDMADASQRLFNLRPVTFRYTKPYGDGSKPVHFGLVAEEVAQVFPELAVHDANGNVETVHYETLSVLLLNELKKEHDEVQLQRQRLDLLEQRLNDLTERRNVSATEP